MVNVLMTVTCMLSNGNYNLSFEVNNDHLIQSVEVFDFTEAKMEPYSVLNQKMSPAEISFSAAGRNAEPMHVSINLDEGADYGASTIKFGPVNEQTPCIIGKW